MAHKASVSPIVAAQCHPALAAAVRLGADRELMTISEFTRRALIDRLRWHGIDPTAPAAGERAHDSHEVAA